MKTLMTILVLIFFLVIYFSCKSSVNKKTHNKPPNILILLADDLGYGDLSCYGSQSIETPNLDALASQGMRFTRFYAGSAVCSPSRACLLTGNFPLRVNATRHFDDKEMHLPIETVTLPEILKQNGYTTGHIGKWHLGGLRPMDFEGRLNNKRALPGPQQHGFDYYLANIEGEPIRSMLINDRKLYREGGKYLVENDHRLPENDEHWTVIKANKAIELVNKWNNETNPYYLQIWFDVPHTPYEPAPEPHLSKYQALGCEGDQLYFRSMVSHMDEQIGRIIQSLKETGQFENTIILFSSDNGPAFQGNPGPFKGGKTDLHEGGIRVPAFWVWKGHIQENSHSFEIGHFVDVFPTICEIANIDISKSKIDGQSILPVLTLDQKIKNRTLLWQMDLYQHFQNQGEKPKPYSTMVAMKGEWKMLADSLKAVELFNLAQDHREIYNLLGTEKTIEDSLSQSIARFIAEPKLNCCK
ncbi:MAG: arylsulfatase [Cyclobacterium sp.]|nr:arylsulfatase [Cyclobacterium sp.]